MFDIGWSEILVIAVVLIVVVGPKDLPPMIRAFGKMTSNLRKMAGDFRNQFDEALREADMDDVRRTISDVQNLNPTNSLRDAMNPLRQLGQDIKSDLQKATTLDDTKSSTVAPSATPVTVPEPSMTLPDTPPVVVAEAAASAPAAAKKAKAPAKPRASKAVAAKAEAAPASEAVTPVKAAPKAKAKTASAAPAATKTTAAKKPASPKAVTEAAAKPAAVKKPVVRKAAATAKTAKKDEA